MVLCVGFEPLITRSIASQEASIEFNPQYSKVRKTLFVWPVTRAPLRLVLKNGTR